MIGDIGVFDFMYVHHCRCTYLPTYTDLQPSEDLILDGTHKSLLRVRANTPYRWVDPPPHVAYLPTDLPTYLQTIHTYLSTAVSCLKRNDLLPYSATTPSIMD